MRIKPLAVATCFFVTSALQANQSDNFKTLTFLTGCWAGAAGDNYIEENWSNQSGSTMLGTAKTLEDNTLKSFEFLRIKTEGTQVLYIPYINGTEATHFPLSYADAHSARFTNSANDFPKEIAYEAISEGLKISLTGDGEGFIYTLNSISCN